jgi:chromosome segregation ATPase
MTYDEDKAKELHDRITRGEALTAEEKAQLHEWYEAQDQAEFQQLGLASPASVISDLPEQISETLEQIANVTAQIQKLSAENNALRRENLTLRNRLSEHPSPQLV